VPFLAQLHSLSHTHRRSLSKPPHSQLLCDTTLGLSLRSEDIEHLCGSTELAECHRMGQGPFRLQRQEHTCSHIHTHLCTCQFPVKHTESMEQESALQSFATSLFAEHKPTTHICTHHHMSKSLTSLDSNGWKDFS